MPSSFVVRIAVEGVLLAAAAWLSWFAVDHFPARRALRFDLAEIPRRLVLHPRQLDHYSIVIVTRLARTPFTVSSTSTEPFAASDRGMGPMFN